MIHNGVFDIKGPLTSKWYDINTSPGAVAYQEGRMYWDTTTNTYAIYNDDSSISLPIGTQTRQKVYNNSGLAIPAGRLVSITSIDGSGYGVVELTDVTNTASRNGIVGITLSSISNASYGYVIMQGVLTGVDTSAYAPGDFIWASTTEAGRFQTTAPSTNVVKIGIVLTSNASTGSMSVDISNGNSQNVVEQVAEGTNIDIYYGDRIWPVDSAVEGYGVSSTSNKSVGYWAENTGTGNAAYAGFVAKGAGTDDFDNVISMQFFGPNYFQTYLQNKGIIYSTSDLYFMGVKNTSGIFFRLSNTGTASISEANTDAVLSLNSSREVIFPSLTTAIIDAESTGRVATTREWVSGNYATITDTAPFKETVSTGIISGGALSINADNTKFDVAAGKGYIVDNTVDPPTITTVEFGPFTAQTVTNLATAFATDIAINSSGNIVQQSSFTDAERRSLIMLGGLDHSNQTNISSVFAIQSPVANPASSVQELSRAIGDINISGNVYNANGANLSIDKSGGIVFSYGRNNVNDETNPHKITTSSVTTISFGRVFNNGSGIGSFTTPGTTIDPNFYDNGTGTLAAVPVNNWTIQRILFFPNDNKTFVQYGTATYNRKEDALNAVPRAVFEPLAGIRTAMVRGYLIVKEGETDLTSTDTEFLSADRFGTVAGLDGGASFVAWGGITGTLSDQTDLQTILDGYDTHVADSTIHFTQGSISIPLSQLSDVDSATQTAGFVLASSGGNYAGRALIASDIPDLSGTYSTLTVDPTPSLNQLTVWSGTNSVKGVSNLRWTLGGLLVGNDLSDQGVVRMYGEGTGFSSGGAAVFYTAQDYTATEDHYTIQADFANFTIKDSGGANLMIYDTTNDRWQLSTYGGTQKTGTATWWLAVDASGNIIEEAAPGPGVSFGTDNQIPHMNAGGTDFDYSANFIYDGFQLKIFGGTNDYANLLYSGLTIGGDYLGANDDTMYYSGDLGIIRFTENTNGGGQLTLAFDTAFATGHTLTLPTKTDTIATLNDITGTNSGTNTGDQSLTNTSDATSHTVTLSASGGSVQLVEGANITLTTSGTGADGIVTIASTGGGSSSWIDLTDTDPTGYAGSAGYLVRVNATPDGLEFVDGTTLFASTSHTHLLAAGATDVTATAAEVNLLDLAGLTAGWVLRASGATTAAWAQLAGSDINNDLGWNNYTHPNHTGEVTSVADGATALAATAISNKTLVTAAAGDYVLIEDATDGALKKVNVSDFGVGGAYTGWLAGGDSGANQNVNSGDLYDVVGGTGMSTTVSKATTTVTLQVDPAFNNFAQKTGDLIGTDRLVGVSGSTHFAESISAIPLSIFNNDSGWTSNIGDITRVNITAGTGLGGTVDTTTGDHTQTLNLTVDTLAEKTGALVGTDRLTGTSGTTNFSETINQIPLSIFNNDAGFISSTAGDWTGTFDGQEGTYYLDYNNFTNTPSIPANLPDLGDVVSATNTNRFVLVANGTTGYVGRALVEADISDLQSYALASHSHTLSDVTDVTATASELNLLDLSGLTTGWVLRATGATTAAWGQLLGSQISNDLGWTTQNLTLGLDNQIPIMNAAGTDFEYSYALSLNGNTLEIGTGSGSNGQIDIYDSLGNISSIYNNSGNLNFNSINGSYLFWGVGGTNKSTITPQSGGDYTYTLPAATGTVALTSDIISTLGGLSDVTITAIAANEILKWNGAAWINNTLAEAGISAVGHTHPWGDITGTPTTLAGYGISDTKANFNTALSDGTFLFVGDVTSFPGFTTVAGDYAGVTATDAEINLLDLSGLTTGWVLRATGAATAAWSQLNTSDLNNDSGWTDQNLTLGTSDQIPHMNTGGTDFDYSSGLTYSATQVLNLGIASSAAGTFTIRGNGTTTGGQIQLYNGATYNAQDFLYTIQPDTSGDFAISGSTSGEFYRFDSTAGRTHISGELQVSSDLFVQGNDIVFGTSTTEGEYFTRTGNDIQIFAGGSSRLTIDGDNGRIGVNDSSPATLFEIQQSADNLGGGFRITDTGGRNLNIYSTGSISYLDLQGTSNPLVFNRGTAGDFRWTNGATEYMRVTSNGELCIGRTTASNNALLNVDNNKSTTTANGEEYIALFDRDYTATDATTGGLKQGIRLNTKNASTSNTLSTMQGILSIASGTGNGGTTTSIANLWLRVDSSTGHTVDNGRVIHIQNGSVGGTMTNQYGIYMEALTSATNNWGLYINGSSLDNFIQGNLGLGITNPSEKLQVYNGSAFVQPIAYAASQDDWALKMGAYNNASFDQGIKLKSTTGGSSYMSFEGAATANALNIYSNGFVAINWTDNTSAPTTYRFNVLGSSNFTADAHFDTHIILNANNTSRIRGKNTGGTEGDLLWVGGDDTVIIGDYSNQFSNVRFFAAGSEAMQIHSASSNVLIGTTLNLGYRLQVAETDTTASAGVGAFRFQATSNYGSGKNLLYHRQDNNSIVINEDAADLDFRIEGVTQPNLFWVDAGSNLVRLRSSSEILRLEDSSATGNPYVSWYQLGTRRAFIQYVDGGDTFSIVNEYGPMRFRTGTGGTEVTRMTISSNGDILLQDAVFLDVNNEYLWGTLSGGGSTRILGISSADHQYFGSIDSAVNDTYVGNNTTAIYFRTGNVVRASIATSGGHDYLYVGRSDAEAGKVVINGHATASTVGGELWLRLAADHDSNIDRYQIIGSSEDLYIGHNVDTDLLWYDYSASLWKFTKDVEVPDEAYGSGWDASTEVPTKNAVYDKLESHALLQTVKVSLSSAQILALNTTPITLVAAQGAGTVVTPVAITLRNNIVGSAYTGNVTPEVVYSGQSTPIITDTNGLTITTNTPRRRTMQNNFNALENTAITITEPTGNPSSGTNTMDVYVQYYVLTL